MGGHPRSSSFNAGSSHGSQQILSGDLYAAMGNISGGIMRFNISDYDPAPDISLVVVQQKKDRDRVPRNSNSDQIAPDARGTSSSFVSSQKPAKA